MGADKIVLLKDGKVAEWGSPKEFLEQGGSTLRCVSRNSSRASGVSEKILCERVDKCRLSVYNDSKFAYANLLKCIRFGIANSKEENERNGICHRPSLRCYICGAENSEPRQSRKRGGGHHRHALPPFCRVRFPVQTPTRG